ncbi:hypothetical protein DACRYDRAFT_93526 [Dacryopinax primogenitus]|uniref:DUF6533 domain-containing protein n=1 Tax=Dacryopinax primogenitus (strain DJM 731) TaxID=1858805 RepID=M5G1I5_DACPD|nr:uncharacterized protein DACRYDRAFT_93526 [Dacryopinax primogenitus]EJU04086.1 hypothetical protein DACRYDRAFT_93526 [Dacryopinax primogenitus]
MSSNSTTPFDPDTWSYLNNVLGAHYALVAAFAWLAIDWLLCMGMEMKYIWTAPWGSTKGLYLFTRYFGLAILALLVITFNLSNVSPSMCIAFFQIGTWGSVWMMGTVSYILLLRIHAMYARSRRVGIFSVVIYFAHLVAAFGILGVSVQKSYTPPDTLAEFPTMTGCFVNQSNPILVTYWIFRLLFDAILLLMVGYKTTHRYVSYSGIDLLDVMIKDNVSAFIFIFCVQSINLFASRLAPVELSGVGLPFSIATDIIMSTRLILHIREAFFGTDDEEEEQGLDFKDIPMNPLLAASRRDNRDREAMSALRSQNRGRHNSTFIGGFEDDDDTERAPGVMVTVEIQRDEPGARRSTFARQPNAGGN